MTEYSDEYKEPVMSAEELDECALKLLQAIGGAREEGRPQQATMLLRAAPRKVVLRAKEILDRSPRYWFEHVDELRDRIMGDATPEERERREEGFQRALRAVWDDYASRE